MDSLKEGRGGKDLRAPALRLREPFKNKKSPAFWAELFLFLKWCPGTESNRRHTPFQGAALPTELPGQKNA